jgi:hypothetical protein
MTFPHWYRIRISSVPKVPSIPVLKMEIEESDHDFLTLMQNLHLDSDATTQTIRSKFDLAPNKRPRHSRPLWLTCDISEPAPKRFETSITHSTMSPPMSISPDFREKKVHRFDNSIREAVPPRFEKEHESIIRFRKFYLSRIYFPCTFV